MTTPPSHYSNKGSINGEVAKQGVEPALPVCEYMCRIQPANRLMTHHRIILILPPSGPLPTVCSPTQHSHYRPHPVCLVTRDSAEHPCVSLCLSSCLSLPVCPSLCPSALIPVGNRAGQSSLTGGTQIRGVGGVYQPIRTPRERSPSIIKTIL